MEVLLEKGNGLVNSEIQTYYIFDVTMAFGW